MTLTTTSMKNKNSDENEMVLMSSLWSSDKDDENLSDWTLTVNRKTEYYVHRIALAPPNGPRVCRYFIPLFFSPKVWSESHSCNSEIELPPGVAAVMNLFLDYVYTGKTDVDVENFVQLRFIANYFGCESFFMESGSYKLSEYMPIEFDAIVSQYDIAKEYHDEEYLDILFPQLTKCLSEPDFVHTFDEGDYDDLFDGDEFDLTLLLNSKPPDDHQHGGHNTVFYFASVRRILINAVDDPEEVS
jgi:BTB/POZ domain